MRGEPSNIGFSGTGADFELTSVCRGKDGPPIETERAWLLRVDDGTEVWMPKSAFNEDGMLYQWAVPMLEEKLAKGESER